MTYDQKMKNKGNIINDWLEKNGDAEIEQFVTKNLEIVSKVNDILKEKGITKVQFAKMLHKKPPEITKWLNGTHNLTLKSIIKMEVALNEVLIEVNNK